MNNPDFSFAGTSPPFIQTNKVTVDSSTTTILSQKYLFHSLATLFRKMIIYN